MSKKIIGITKNKLLKITKLSRPKLDGCIAAVNSSISKIVLNPSTFAKTVKAKILFKKNIVKSKNKD